MITSRSQLELSIIDEWVDLVFGNPQKNNDFYPSFTDSEKCSTIFDSECTKALFYGI